MVPLTEVFFEARFFVVATIECGFLHTLAHIIQNGDLEFGQQGRIAYDFDLRNPLVPDLSSQSVTHLKSRQHRPAAQSLRNQSEHAFCPSCHCMLFLVA